MKINHETSLTVGHIDVAYYHICHDGNTSPGFHVFEDYKYDMQFVEIECFAGIDKCFQFRLSVDQAKALASLLNHAAKNIEANVHDNERLIDNEDKLYR